MTTGWRKLKTSQITLYVEESNGHMCALPCPLWHVDSLILIAKSRSVNLIFKLSYILLLVILHGDVFHFKEV